MMDGGIYGEQSIGEIAASGQNQKFAQEIQN